MSACVTCLPGPKPTVRSSAITRAAAASACLQHTDQTVGKTRKRMKSPTGMDETPTSTSTACDRRSSPVSPHWANDVYVAFTASRTLRGAAGLTASASAPHEPS